MISKRELITQDNVARTYNEGKYVCFVLRNGIVVKIDPNERVGGEEEKTEGKQ